MFEYDKGASEMKMPESKYRANQKYQRDKCRDIKFQFNRTIDADILVWLDSQENKQGYIKRLIRADMEAHGFKMPDATDGAEK